MGVETIGMSVGLRVRIRTDVGFVPMAGKRGEVVRVCDDGDPMPVSVVFRDILSGDRDGAKDMTLCYRRSEIEIV